MKITILYDGDEDRIQAEEKAAGGDPSPLVYEQLSEVLSKRGHRINCIAAEVPVRKLATLIERDTSDIIFNVCESFGGSNQHEQNVAALLELFGKRFTGSGSLGLALAQDKALAKKLLSFHGISTPRFSVVQAGAVDWADDLAYPLFVKPSNADASIGIDEGSIVHNLKELLERMSYIQTEFQAPALIEEFIEGREIYVGVLGNTKPEPLPILEWDFSRMPADVPKIASSESKWDQQSPGYQAPQRFPDDIPEPVYKAVQQAAVEAYKSLKLRDYGRIDMRLRETKHQANGHAHKPGAHGADIDGWEFYLIEVNPNPHLARDGELALAARQRGLEYEELIEAILQHAQGRD